MSAEMECFVVYALIAGVFVAALAYVRGYGSGYNDGRDAGLRLGYLRGYFDYLLEKSTTDMSWGDDK